MAWIWTMAISVIIFLYLLHQLLNLKKKRNLPPGPNGLPILGHFHLLSKNPHQDLHRLAQKYGPIMLMRLRRFVGELRQAAADRRPVDMSAKISSLGADLTCMMVFGRKFADRDLDAEIGFMEVMRETVEESSAFNIGDYFPYLRWLDLHGSTRRLKKLSKIFDGFLERIIDDHAQMKKQSTKETARDFVDTLMDIMESGEAGFDFDRRHVKAVLLDLLVAGMDTSSTSIEWILADLIRHPTIMKKLQKELEEIVGMNQMVEESHLSSLKYLDCVIKESMRLHPVGPFLIHESMQDCEVDGFHIPKETRVLVNVWAIGRDPNDWTDPEAFCPDRFIGSNIDLRGRDFQLIPFVSGRRECPRLQLGLTVVQLVVAQLVHCFDYKLSDGMLHSELDMSEQFGLVTA